MGYNIWVIYQQVGIYQIFYDIIMHMPLYLLLIMRNHVYVNRILFYYSRHGEAVDRTLLKSLLRMLADLQVINK